MQNPSRFDSMIRRIGDFPVPGVTFYDVTPLLSDGEAFREAVSALTDPFLNARIQKVVGAEARGFFVAPAIAHELRAGFVPIPKSGKLPFRTRRHQESLADTEGVVNSQNFVPGGATTYVKPYDFELHSDAIREGENVLVVGHLLAKGGTAAACCRLVESSGGTVSGCAFLIELASLRGAERLSPRNVFSLLRYGGHPS